MRNLVLVTILYFLFNSVMLFAQVALVLPKPCNDGLSNRVLTSTDPSQISQISSMEEKALVSAIVKRIEHSNLQNDQDVEFFNDSADTLIIKGYQEEAKKILSRVLEKDKHNIRALTLMGICLGNTKEALDHFYRADEEAIKNKVIIDNLHNATGWALWRLDKANADKALIEYDKEMKGNPGNWLPYGNRPLIFRYRGDNELAFQDYQKSIEISGNDLQAILIAARFSEQLQVHPKEGLKWVRKALELYPNSWRAWEILAGFYFHEKKYKKAAKLYLHSIKLYPRATTYYELCWTYIKMGKIPSAIDAFKKAKNLNQTPDTCYEDTARDLFKEKGIKV